jgi:hypothetical protein
LEIHKIAPPLHPELADSGGASRSMARAASIAAAFADVQQMLT